MICSQCGSESPEGFQFCGSCGSALGPTCPACGADLPGSFRFCGRCGADLSRADPATAGQAAASASVPASERRLVSVLFADLVGFTTLSEGRDSEEVRELLFRYFDACRRLVELYGGVVEKFIGDAVMAVWGAHSATEDDAERAVRAALDLVAAVSALGDEVGLPELRARAGVLTGEATVTPGAEGEGLVAGDVVNSASRLQSLAEPGRVLVGESTRRTTEPTIVYEDAGTHELRGKAGLHRLWRAVRVVSGARGALKSEGLEAPFVGRDRELRQIKDLFHASADERRAQLVSVTGIAGIGKSRLVWEFYKYFDGLPQIVYWHRGRCLSYGEGVTYWALADMVRMRCRIAEDEQPASALAKLSAVLGEHITDAEERRFVEPRVAHLLGLEEGARYERDDLFAAWRAFFERLADVYPTVLAFEDMQWADGALLDFIEYLLERARNSPLYVITVARPELVERRPTWGAGERNFTSIYLEPLSESAMHDLLADLVPGLPAALLEQILARAEGVPLYAVETVRMLLDRGHLVREGSAYRPAGPVETLEVPETLHALIAARLDGLSPQERRVIQDGAVLGKTFTQHALAALSGSSVEVVSPVLAGLVRKEVLSIQADPRSPEHGQYGFLQDLVRHVAYETLSRRERRIRHLAAAAYLESTFPEEDDIVEVLASHYLDAYNAAPGADDAEAAKQKARALLVRAGERAESLAAAAEAQRYFEQACDLTERPSDRAALLDRAGQMARRTGDADASRRLFESAISIYDELGDTHAAARVSSRLAWVEQAVGLHEDAIARMEHAYSVISDDQPDFDLALLLCRLGSAEFFAGRVDRAAELTERALDVGEALRLPEVLSQGWNTKAQVITGRGRPEEARGLLRLSLEVALEDELFERAAVACGNLSDLAFQRDHYEEALDYLGQALALARKIGNRPEEWFALSEATYGLFMLGRWDEALASLAEVPEDQLPVGGTLLSPLTSGVEIHLHRGRQAEARRLLAIYSRLEESTDVQEQICYHAAMAAMLHAEGRHADALAAGQRAVAGSSTFGIGSQAVKQGLVWAVEAALALNRPADAEQLLNGIDELRPGIRPPSLDAHLHRLRARLRESEEAAEADFSTAAERFRELHIPFWRAVTLLECSQRLAGRNDAERVDGLRAEAGEIFRHLGAAPWASRAEAAGGLRTAVPGGRLTHS